MGMEQAYDFFDREAFDPVWRLSWAEFLKTHRTRWAANRKYSPGEYYNESLRGLISFSIDPQPSSPEIEDILRRRTIRWTLRQSNIRLFTMSEIMSNVPSLRDRVMAFSMKCEIDSLLAAAVDAYLNQRAGVAAFRAVFKLHCVTDPGSFLKLNRHELTTLRVAFPAAFQVQEPIYSWLGPYWDDGEHWTNGLNVAETRTFVAFVIRAWEENWPCPRIKGMELNPFSEQSRFRDFGLHKALASAARRRVTRWQKPCVFRQWA
jgi:hypothetical protein